MAKRVQNFKVKPRSFNGRVSFILEKIFRDNYFKILSISIDIYWSCFDGEKIRKIILKKSKNSPLLMLGRLLLLL
jgi:hypothetical protein